MSEAHFKSSEGFETTVGPHEFTPLRRFFNRGRCRHCLYHEEIHPALYAWWPARALGDKSVPDKHGQSEKARDDCTGASDCTAKEHIHGCFAERGPR